MVICLKHLSNRNASSFEYQWLKIKHWYCIAWLMCSRSSFTISLSAMRYFDCRPPKLRFFVDAYPPPVFWKRFHLSIRLQRQVINSTQRCRINRDLRSTWIYYHRHKRIVALIHHIIEGSDTINCFESTPRPGNYSSKIFFLISFQLVVVIRLIYILIYKLSRQNEWAFFQSSWTTLWLIFQASTNPE